MISLSVAVQVEGAWHQAGGPGAPSAGGFVSQWTGGKVVKVRIRRRDGASFQASQVRAEIVSPLLNYAHVVVPDCGRHYILSRQAFMIRAPLYRVSGQNAGLPFFALADEAGEFFLGFGVVSAAGEVKVHRITPLISTRKALVGGDDLLKQRFEWAGPGQAVRELELELLVSEDEPTWFHALRRFGQAVKDRDGITYPDNPDAWRPTWCTWPAWVSDRMNEQSILANAEVARDLGIGTIIIDDGWFGPGLDTEHPVLNLGDYQPDPAKFQDLPALIAQMQQMGLKVLLWFASLPVARTSQAYQKFKQYAMYEGNQEYTSVNGLALLCPACPEIRSYVADEVERLLRTYKPDGLKVDLYNCLPQDMCTSPHHSHDVHDAVEAVEKTMAGLWDRARSINPDVLIELKQDYGNVRLTRHGTMVRAGDTAYDIDSMTWRCFYSQAFAPVVHNDYLITSVHTRPQAMAQLLIRMIASGVPTFGLDFPKFGGDLRAVIAAWIGFYNANVAMFKKPRQPQDNDFSAWQGGDRRTAWVAALRHCRQVSLPAAGRAFLINGTGAGDLQLKIARPRKAKVAGYDYRLRKVSQTAMTLRDGMTLPVPPAGMLEII